MPPATVQNQNPAIAAVVVTHNRLSLLKECVASLRSQTRKPDAIYVVDNGSTDETGSWLGAQSGLRVIRQDNLGSAGGQYAGLKAAHRDGHDWVWCMDDDSLPSPQALEFLTKCPRFEKDKTGFLASVVFWKDGSVHGMNLTNPTFVQEWIGRVLDDRCVKVQSASFVGVLVSRAAITKVGFPIKEFFIWGDDIEYTRRISRHFPCFAVLDSKVTHQTKENVGAGDQINPADNHSVKTRCLYRNNVALLLLDRASLLRRINRIAAFVIQELGRAKTFGRALAVLRYSVSGLGFYLKVRKADLHQ